MPGNIHRYFTWIGAIALLSCACAADAADKLLKIDTRPGVTVSYYYMPRADATATVVLLTGGNGSIGMRDGVPRSENFLVRSRDLFAAHGFNIAIVGRPSDRQDLSSDFRIAPQHVEDLRKVVAHLKKNADLPIWLVGTSRGTVSATAAAIEFGNDALAGIVVTASITRGTGAVPRQNLERIRIPVLAVHHEKDGCAWCWPYEVSKIMKGLTNAPIKKQIMIGAGRGASGDPCEALHWHGFIGAEKETVDLIAAWIKRPIY
ncbi:MAG TPA: alpha/beta hydrolase [Burkholderiales bacterium]|nr:alpha/beta hydrolase [Burkholderiales bacterium]